MRMLPQEEETGDDGTQVSWDDQQRINTFSKLNARIRSIMERVEVLKQEKEALDDLSLELELADEDELVLYRVGEAFLHMRHTQATRRLSKDQAAVDTEISQLGTRADECETEMKALKVALYAKFGNAINLDE
ncbi:Prefoldin subunit-domain-containing protein [Amylostereum chailletii]|nr:Prefoldin subunit-domain-containing protein [Amylostereum chailletii]